MSEEQEAAKIDDAYENLKCPSCNIPYRDGAGITLGLLVCDNCGGATFKGRVYVTADHLKQAAQ